MGSKLSAVYPSSNKSKVALNKSNVRGNKLLAAYLRFLATNVALNKSNFRGNKLLAAYLRFLATNVALNKSNFRGNKLPAAYSRFSATNVASNISLIMGKKGPKKHYFVVCRGRTTGILEGWAQCEASTSGFSSAKFKGYETHSEAEEAWHEWLSSQGIAPNQGAPQNTLEHNLTDIAVIANQVAINNNLQSRVALKRKYEDREVSSNIIADVTIIPSPGSKAEDSANSTDKIIIDLTESPEAKTSFVNIPVSEGDNSPAPKKAKSADDKPSLNLDIEIPDSEFEFSDDDLFDKITLCETAPKSIELTAEQDNVVKMAMSGYNIFLTGAAGSGKTVTLLQIIKRLKKKLQDDNPNIPKVQVAAPTGLAALPLNGRTTYSVAGWKPDSFKMPLEKLLDSTKKRTIKALRKLEVLILEEISMVESQFLERLNLLLQTVKENKRPFGGVQVIFLGDFYQLPQ